MVTDYPPASWKRQPWKNGGGTTYEVARWPADADDYDLRVSVADVERDGPFSRFPGFGRVTILLAGAVELVVTGGTHHLSEAGEVVEAVVAGRTRRMSEVGDVVVIDGNLAIEARLFGGPARLLNIFARNPGPRVNVGLAAPEKPVRFVFALDDGGELPRGHARLFDPPGQIEQRVIWIE